MARKHGIDRGITQRKDRPGWWVRIYHQGRQLWFRCDTKSQAKTLYGRLKAEQREGRFFPEKFSQPKSIPLRAWITRYLEGCTNRGLANERRYGRRWSLLLGKRVLSQITTEELSRIQAKMRAHMTKSKNGRKPPRRTWSDGTINRHFAFLRHVLMVAVRDRILTWNPVSGIKFLPEARRTRFLGEDELTRLRGVMAREDWKLVAFSVETGLRRAEQFALRWDQVDLESGVLTIPLPKGGRTRHVPLSDGALAILRSLDSFASSPWVFPSPQDPLLPRSATSIVNNVYAPALRRAGIQGACWHTLRHTAASRRIMAGADLVSVKEFMGHRDITTTLRYAHLAPGHLRDAVNRGSLGATVTKTVTKQENAEESQILAGSETVEELEEEKWLGDQDSNLGNQIQSLMSYH